MLIEKYPLSGRDARSADLQCEHSLDVPAHRYQIRFAFDVLQSSQQTLAISHHGFDDVEHRLGCLFAQRIKLSSSRGLQSMRDVGPAEITVVGKDAFDAAQLLRQRLDLLDRWPLG